LSNEQQVGTSSRPLLLGHRGARCYAPENTLAAFEFALAHGCDGFEFDVRRSADGRAVVCHNERISRQRVAATSYKKLQKLNPTLVSLEDVLARFARRAYLYIELKVSGLEDDVLRTLAAYPPVCGYVVASFEPDILCTMRARSSNIPLGLICGDHRHLLLWRRLPVQLIMLHWHLARRSAIESLHATGKQVFAWTLNRPARMRSALEAGVDGILSDNTDLLVRTLRPRGECR
jgi:glycerophosphoryl diester phosphodiesterase